MIANILQILDNIVRRVNVATAFHEFRMSEKAWRQDGMKSIPLGVGNGVSDSRRRVNLIKCYRGQCTKAPSNKLNHYSSRQMTFLQLWVWCGEITLPWLISCLLLMFMVIVSVYDITSSLLCSRLFVFPFVFYKCVKYTWNTL